MLRTIVLAMSVLTILTGGAGANVADFDGLSLAANSYWNGGPVPHDTGSFTSGPATLNNSFFYDAIYDMTSWGGWAYSNKSDVTTPDWTNQYSVITGAGQGGSANYGIGYIDMWNGVSPAVTLATPSVVDSAWFTNTTYAYYAIRDGTPFSKTFGGDDGTDPDWFLLTITGKNASGAATGSVDFYLADYRFADGAKNYLVNTWQQVDLTSLGVVKTLEMDLTSSDSGFFGMNSPSYFAMDTLTVSPEPATLGLLAVGLAAMIRRRRA